MRSRPCGVGRLWRSLDAVYVEIGDAARLMNINTPDDLRAAEARLARDTRERRRVEDAARIRGINILDQTIAVLQQ